MKKLLTALLAAALMISCVGCGNNAEIEALKKENEELKSQLKESNNTQAVSPTPDVSTKETDFKAEWVDDGTPFTCSVNESKIDINKDIFTLYEDGKGYIRIDLTYTNSSAESKNFINDYNVAIIAFQNGIELEEITSDVDDSRNCFKLLKNGASIQTLCAFELNDIESEIEVEIGNYSDYDKKIIKKIKLSK